MGALVATFAAERLAIAPVGNLLAQTAFGCVVMLAALGASVFHLGRPLLAYRAVLGLRTSWLSREALAFGLFAKLAILYGGLTAAPLLPDFPMKEQLVSFAPEVRAGALVFGIVGVFCSVMVYVATRREHWSFVQTGVKFFGTTLLLGCAAVLAVSARCHTLQVSRTSLLLSLLAGVTLIKLAFEAHSLGYASDRRGTALKRMALVMRGELRHVTVIRFALLLLGGLFAACHALLEPSPGARRDRRYHVHPGGTARCRAGRALPVLPRGARLAHAWRPPVSEIIKKVTRAARELLITRDGPLTRELLQEPGKFGLGHVPSRLAPDATTTMVCGFCSTGCGLKVHLKDGEAVEPHARHGLSREPRHGLPQGLGGADVRCAAPVAPTTPLLRNATASLRPCRGKTPCSSFCDASRTSRTSTARAPSPSSAPARCRPRRWRSSARSPSSAWACVHGDGNTRQCMATSVVAYKQSFGFDAPPFTYADFEESDVLVLVGSNLCIAHPIMWQRVLPEPAQARRSSSSIRARPRRRWPRTQHSPLKPQERPHAALRPRPTC